MAFTATHWDEFTRQGYTIVHGAIHGVHLRAAQEAAEHLTSIFPEGWQRSKNELWREIKDSHHPTLRTR